MVSTGGQRDVGSWVGRTNEWEEAASPKTCERSKQIPFLVVVVVALRQLVKEVPGVGCGDHMEKEAG